jgi:hypothetical protein
MNGRMLPEAAPRPSWRSVSRIASQCGGKKYYATSADEGFGVDHWNALLRVQERQSALLASLATKLRLTPQSRYGPRSADTAARNEAAGPPPWEE